MRCAAILVVIAVVVSSPTRADTTLQCSETLYDKIGNHSYKALQYFILQDGSVFRQATLFWDNTKKDLSLVTNTPATLEATGRAWAFMPLPAQIEQCVNAALADRPNEREANGTVNHFRILECVSRADVSDTEVETDVSVTINRITGDLKILRQQDNNSQHDTEQFGSCKVATPLF